MRLTRISRRDRRPCARRPYCERSFRARSVTIEAVSHAPVSAHQGAVLSSCRLSMRACFCVSVMASFRLDGESRSGVMAEGVAAGDVVFAGGAGKLATTSESNEVVGCETGCFLARCGGMMESRVDEWRNGRCSARICVGLNLCGVVVASVNNARQGRARGAGAAKRLARAGNIVLPPPMSLRRATAPSHRHHRPPSSLNPPTTNPPRPSALHPSPIRPPLPALCFFSRHFRAHQPRWCWRRL